MIRILFFARLFIAYSGSVTSFRSMTSFRSRAGYLRQAYCQLSSS